MNVIHHLLRSEKINAEGRQIKTITELVKLLTGQAVRTKYSILKNIRQNLTFNYKLNTGQQTVNYSNLVYIKQLILSYYIFFINN